MKCTSGAHTSYVHRHLVSSAISRHVRFASSRRSAAKSVFCECRRGKMVIPKQFTVETHPISVRWKRRRQWGGTIIPVYSWHTHSKRTQNTQKCMKFINYLSLLRFSLLLSNCAGSHSAFIYKFKDANCNTHAPMKGTSRPNMYTGGWSESFKMGALLSVWNALELIHKSGYVSRVTLPHKHEDTGANAALLTYLLNGEILLLIRRWPSQQKRALGVRTRYSAAQRWPLVTTTRLSRQHLSITGGTFDHKNFIGDSAMVTHVCSNLLFDGLTAIRQPLATTSRLQRHAPLGLSGGFDHKFYWGIKSAHAWPRCGSPVWSSEPAVRKCCGTLHLAPCTLHLAPCTLHLAPVVGGGGLANPPMDGRTCWPTTVVVDATTCYHGYECWHSCCGSYTSCWHGYHGNGYHGNGCWHTTIGPCGPLTFQLLAL